MTPAPPAVIASHTAAPAPSTLADPDAPIATPRKDLLNPKDYLVFNPIQTTRGCPHGCTFCTTPAIFGRRFRQRNIPDIIEEEDEAEVASMAST
jgi:radical SAM superfamily enzyme YgiQ (UPF0313 family)